MSQSRLRILAITIPVLLVLLASPALAGKGKTYGEPLTGSDVTQISVLLDDPEPYVGKTVRVEGVITGVCEKRGCWVTLASDEEFEELRIKAKDGVIVNLQVQEGMVAGIIRAGAIATLIVDENPYVLAAYRQENLKNVREGQPVVVALNNYPGEHFTGKVEEIWWASRRGQFVPSGNLPVFPDLPVYREVRFPVKITLDDPSVRLPIGAAGATLILTSDNPFTWLGQISLRTYTWSRWLYPLPF